MLIKLIKALYQTITDKNLFSSKPHYQEYSLLETINQAINNDDSLTEEEREQCLDQAHAQYGNMTIVEGEDGRPVLRRIK